MALYNKRKVMGVVSFVIIEKEIVRFTLKLKNGGNMVYVHGICSWNLRNPVISYVNKYN